MEAAAEIVTLCREHLDSLPGVRKVTVTRVDDAARGDARLLLATEVGRFTYAASVMRRLSPQRIDHWLLAGRGTSRARSDQSRRMLLADYVPPGLGTRLADAGVDYVDVVGNVSIRQPRKLYVVKSGAKPVRLSEQKPGRLLKPSGLQVLFALLADTSAVRLPYRTLATRAGVALGSIAVIADELKRKGYLVPRRDGLHLARQRELLDLLVSGYADQLRSRLVLGVFRSPERDLTASLDRLRQVAGERHISYAISGGFAAEALTHHYRGDRLVAFVSEWPATILRDLRWLPSAGGPITILRQFAPTVAAPLRGADAHPVAHPLLVYAELLHGGTERERETARIVYEQYVARLVADDDA